MSIGFIQVGQCGNQIGDNIFKNLISELKTSSESFSQLILDSFFTISSQSNLLIPNSILIDMESKVIEKITKQSKSHNIKYNPSNIINKQSGSGNNWANGFFNHGPSIEKIFIEKFSKFTENFDYLDTIILINSLAGGTGSGLGSYINILLKDYFPEINILNVAVWPHNSGEVIVNSYNTLFSISENYKVSDMMMIVNNQEIYDICKDIYNIKKIGFNDLNMVISKHILSTISPINFNKNNYISTDIYVKPFNLNSFISELIYFLCPNPKLKFVRLISTPEISEDNLKFTNNNWNSLIKRAAQMLKNYSNESKVDWTQNELIKNFKCACIYRGKNLNDINNNINNNNNENNNNVNDIKLLTNKQNCDFIEYKDINIVNKYEKSVTLLSNCNFFNKQIENTLNKAKEMYMYNAFVHQYEKYGMSKDDFLEAFIFNQQIISDYDNI